MPSLVRMRHDREEGELTADEEDRILAAAGEDIGQLVMAETGAAGESGRASAVGAEAKFRILGCPAHHRAEESALQMLAPLLAASGAHLEVGSTRTLPTEIEESIEHNPPALLLVAIVAPGGLVQARYLCRRLRRRFPQLKIVVAYFGRVRSFDKLLVRLRSAGASYVTTSLGQARSQIKALLPAPAPALVEAGVEAGVAAQPAAFGSTGTVKD
jgi:hypothetical protein